MCRARLWFSICILKESKLSAVSLHGLLQGGEDGIETVNVYLLFFLFLAVAKHGRKEEGVKTANQYVWIESRGARNCCEVASAALQLSDEKGRRAGQKTSSFFPVCVILSVRSMSPKKVVPTVPEVSAIPFRARLQCSSLGGEWGAPAVVPREKQVPAGGGAGSQVLPAAEMAKTDQGELGTFGCNGGSRLGDMEAGKKE